MRFTQKIDHDILPKRQNNFPMRFPRPESRLDQDQEWCEVEIDGEWQTVRFHDYSDIYEIPGLYESLFYRTLQCISPRVVVDHLERIMHRQGEDPRKLRVLDIGAGNGMVGEALRSLPAEKVFGIDVIDQAQKAAQRDRDWAYDDYVVVDLTDMPERLEKHLRSLKSNAMVCVAALGYGDIPTSAFLNAVDLLSTPAWLAFNIKEDFLHDDDGTGFCRLVRELSRRKIIQVQSYERYTHRLSITGEPLYYVTVVARKLKDVPDELRDLV